MEQKIFESKENGRNVHIRAKFIRHGEKNSFDGGLTDKGVENAKEYGREFKPLRDGVKGFHSQIKRSKDTLENITQEIDVEKKYKSRQRNDLLLNDPDEMLWSEDSLRKYKELVNENTGDENAALDWYLSYGEQRPDPNTVSPREVATRLANLVEKYVRMVSKLKNGSSVDFVHVSHSGTIEPFLQQVIGNEIEQNPINPEGKTFLEKMGGMINFLEEFEVDIKTNENDDVAVELTFRGHKFLISPEKLKEIANYNEDNDNEQL